MNNLSCILPFSNSEIIPEVMTVDDVSQYLCIGKNTVYELLHSNQLKGFRIGKSWRISKDALNLYIKRSSPHASPL